MASSEGGFCNDLPDGYDYDDDHYDQDQEEQETSALEMAVDDNRDLLAYSLHVSGSGGGSGIDHPDDDDIDDYAPDSTSQELPAAGTAMPSMVDVYGTLGNQSALSSESAIRCLWSPWVTFCTSQARIPSLPTTGLSFYYSVAHGCVYGKDRLDRLVEPGSQLKIDFEALSGFLVFQAAKPDMNRPQFEKTGKFLKAHLKAEFNSLQNLALKLKIPLNIEDHEKKVCGLNSSSGYSKLLKEVLSRKAKQEMRNGTDLQADKERLITNEQRIELINEAFNPTDASVQTTTYLSRLGFVAQKNKAFQIGKRGEALRSHTFGMTYAESYRLGPDGNLMTSFVLSNQGKENSVGRRTCTGFVPHYQPMFDATGSDGILFIYRFGGIFRNDFALAQRLPNFLNPKEILNHHIYPSVTGGAYVEIPRNTYQATWSTMFKACKIVCDKVTHQPRKQVQQEFDFKLCPQELITRFAGYSEGGAGNKNQNLSYLTNQHVGVMSSVGGSPYGHNRPETHNPGYCLTHIEDLIAVLLEVSGLGGFTTQCQDVHDRYDQCGSRKKMAKEGLFMAKGAVSYFYEAVKRAFLVAAARPLHADSGRLNHESLRIYELCKSETGSCVYNNPVFQCAEFMTLVERVTVAQERADNNIIELTSATENALTLALQDNVAGPVQALAAQVLCTNSRLDRMDDRHCCLVNELNRLREVMVHNGLGHMAFPTDGSSLAAVIPFVSPTSSVDSRPSNFSRAFMVDDVDGAMENEVDPGVLAVADSFVQRLAPADDTTANGDARKRKRGVDQEAQVQYQRALGIAQSYCLSTANIQTLEDLWEEYTRGDGHNREPLRDLETKFNVEWRKDIPNVSSCKGVQWCNRLHVYRLVEFYMTRPFRVFNRQDNTEEMRQLTEFEALLEANKTFLCCVAKSGKPNFSRKVVPQFKRQQVYENGVYENGGFGRSVDPTDGIRFIPANVTKLVQTYMDRSLTYDQAWQEADKTIVLSLPQKKTYQVSH
jgi:hypothetical protein